jgi:hypothetical protein
MADVDYYRVLGVRPSATREEIRQAYRRMARRVHPDTNPRWKDSAAASQRMAALNEAYAVLVDPARRTAYDLQRQDGRASRPRASAAPAQGQARSQHTAAEAPSGGRRRSARVVFAPHVERQARLAIVALLLAAAGVYGAYLAVNRGLLHGVVMMAAGLLGAALCAMAVMPTFQGRVVLERDALIEYSSFGAFGERVVRYDQICGVHWRAGRGYGASARIMLDYFEDDRWGRPQTDCYQSKWLMPVDDPHSLYRLLRARASGRKLTSSRPSWRAMLVSARELVWMVMVVFVTIVVALFWSAMESGG